MQTSKPTPEDVLNLLAPICDVLRENKASIPVGETALLFLLVQSNYLRAIPKEEFVLNLITTAVRLYDGLMAEEAEGKLI